MQRNDTTAVALLTRLFILCTALLLCKAVDSEIDARKEQRLIQGGMSGLLSIQPLHKLDDVIHMKGLSLLKKVACRGDLEIRGSVSPCCIQELLCCMREGGEHCFCMADEHVGVVDACFATRCLAGSRNQSNSLRQRNESILQIVHGMVSCSCT